MSRDQERIILTPEDYIDINKVDSAISRRDGAAFEIGTGIIIGTLGVTAAFVLCSPVLAGALIGTIALVKHGWDRAKQANQDKIAAFNNIARRHSNSQRS